jgi:hypothetical protein
MRSIRAVNSDQELLFFIHIVRLRGWADLLSYLELALVAHQRARQFEIMFGYWNHLANHPIVAKSAHGLFRAYACRSSSTVSSSPSAPGFASNKRRSSKQ